MNTAIKLAAIQAANQDFEWYPTTTEIVNVVKADLEKNHCTSPSVLDCGAGDGRTLLALTGGKRFAIEKSQPLIQFMDPTISIVGTDFFQQTLIDKKVDVVFCNPPYSEFAQWMVKIIKEANAGYLYFVVPQRWNDYPGIHAALKVRRAEVEVLGNFDFYEAERRARAKVNILRVELCQRRRYDNESKVDPFNIWFEETFKLEIERTESSKYNLDKVKKADLGGRLNQELVAGGDLVVVLEKLYQHDLDHLISNYKSLEEIDAELLRELDVNLASLKGGLRLKIEGLKDRYWRELFDNLAKITAKLSTKSREKMLGRLMEHIHVDFTVSNAYALLIWVLKNANVYFDGQLIELVEQMTEQANVALYVSNQTTFKNEHWRYCQRPDDLDRYGLDYRCVLHRSGGICTSAYSWEKTQNGGLEGRAKCLLNDILTVANNLGFDTTQTERAEKRQWESNKAQVFGFFDERSKTYRELMKVRAFKNGNLHIQFNQAFMCRLNVEFGRLKGWLKCKEQAAQELAIPLEEAAQSFNSNIRLTVDQLPRLGLSLN